MHFHRSGIGVALIGPVAVLGLCSIALPAFAADTNLDGRTRSLTAVPVGDLGVQPEGMATRGGGPSNDNCEDVAVPDLSVGECLVFNGDLTGATSTCEDLGALGETWHAFNLLQASDVSTSYCGTFPVFGNAFIVIDPECPCSGLFVFANSFDQSSCDDGNWTIHYNSLPAGDYWTPVILDPDNLNDGPYTWTICAEEGGGPPKVCGPGNGDCCLEGGNGTPGCDDEACCETVCAADPFCCDVCWDSPCAGAANKSCEVCRGPGGEGPGGCETDDDCDDVDECTVDSCDLDTGQCINQEIDCDDGDECTDDFCADGCENEKNAVCCDNCGTCDGDVNCDGAVDPLDSGAILARFGLEPCGDDDCKYDVNCDGAIDPLDSGYVLARFGVCNPVPVCNVQVLCSELIDNCEDAPIAPLNLGETVSFLGDNTDATLTCEALGVEETWHAMDLSADADVTTSLCGTNPPFGNAFIVLEPSCPCSGEFIFATSFDNDTTCTDGNWAIHYDGLPAGVYYTPVLKDETSTGFYTWNISAAELAGPPEVCGPGNGDCCLEGGNGTPGCDDEACCAAICAGDSFCCDIEWDTICADAAQKSCEVCL